MSNISWYVQKRVKNVWKTIAIVQAPDDKGPQGVILEMKCAAMHAPLRKYALAHLKGNGRIVKLGDLYNVGTGELLDKKEMK